jgi:hypothetical protein
MTRHDASTGAVGVLLALALAPAFWPSDAMAQGCTKEATNLIAARTINVGDVNVCNDATTLTVTYETTTPWCLLATNLHVTISEDDIPQNRRGMPQPGRFAFGDEHDCEGEFSFDIPLADIGGGLSPGDTVVIAAHAEVDDGERTEGAWGDGTRFVEGVRSWATYFMYAAQAPTACACDASRTRAGVSGMDILELLCPGGDLAPVAQFVDDGPITGVQQGGSGPAYETIVASVVECVIADGEGNPSVSVPLSSDEAEACQTHLRVSCGQPEPPVACIE